MLLDLAFETELSYASYCDIEDAVGHLPSGTLRSVLLRRHFATFVPWLLVAKAPPARADEELMESLAEQHMPADGPLTVFLRDIRSMRPEHRPPVYRFAVLYLAVHTEGPRAALVRRGFLADVLEIVYPGNRKPQQSRLEEMLRTLYVVPLGKAQISELFANPKQRPTRAFEAAVANLAQRKLGDFVKEQAALARVRRGKDPDDFRTLQRSIQRRYVRRARYVIQETPDPGVVPRATLRAFGVLLVVLLFVALWYVSTHP